MAELWNELIDRLQPYMKPFYTDVTEFRIIAYCVVRSEQSLLNFIELNMVPWADVIKNAQTCKDLPAISFQNGASLSSIHIPDNDFLVIKDILVRLLNHYETERLQFNPGFYIGFF